jgi:Spy/CpxP family protein refolding chaperone
MRAKAAVLILAVFCLGMILGGLTVHLLGSRVSANRAVAPSTAAKDDMPTTKEQVLEQLNTECTLLPEQRTQIKIILDDTIAEYHRVYEPIRPQIEAARQAGRQKMRGVLTPEQLPKFEAYVHRLDEMRKKEEHK